MFRGPCLCGAYDCVACRGPGADSGPCEESAERSWLAYSGYTLDDDGVWGRTVSRRIHTARRDHKDGRFFKGDMYRVITSRNICDETGESWHSHRKKMLKRGPNSVHPIPFHGGRGAL